MCGITGLVWAPEHDALARSANDVLRRMTDRITYRGPDAGDTWLNEKHRVGLGHRRLSIIDLSPHGAQPMRSPSGRYVIVFNGELYNYLDVRAELVAARNPTFRGHSDTEVLLHAVEAWGVEGALQRFAGMFAFGLFDNETATLYLARDRIGEKPLYYGFVGSSFVFASELKPFAEVPGWAPRLSKEALLNYLWLGFVPSPLSIFDNVVKLEPGAFATVPLGHHPRSLQAINTKTYWSLADRIRANPPGSATADRREAKEQLGAILSRSVKQQMLSDVPLGAFLSGGIDSSLIVALMQEHSSRPVKTFSIGFDIDGFNEAPHAAAVAKHLGTDHTELVLSGQDALAVVPNLKDIYDEPFADSSQIPTYLVAKLARSKVTVALSGDGGDEVFGGYTRYIFGPRVWRHLERLPQPLRRAGAVSLEALLPMAESLTPGGGLQTSHKRWINGTRVRKLLGLASAKDFQGVYERLVASWPQPESLVSFAARRIDLFPELANATREESLMLADSLHYLPDDIMVKVDRACMAVSLESRAPFLDHRVVEFAWTLPTALRVQDGVGKVLLRDVLFDKVPRTLLERPKMGFGVPLASWLRGPLKPWAEDLLASGVAKDVGITHPEKIHAKWRKHLSGQDGEESSLWTIFMLLSWAKEWRARLD